MPADEEIVVFESVEAAERVFRDARWGDQERHRPSGPLAPSITPRDEVEVRVTGAKDGTTGLYPGVVVFLNLLPTAPTWSDGDQVRVLPLNGEALESGTRFTGLVAGEKGGYQVVVVVSGGSRVVRGTLVGDLNSGSSTSLTLVGGGTVTVHDVLLPGGRKVVAGKTVVAYFDSRDARYNLCAIPLKTVTLMTGVSCVDGDLVTTTDTFVVPDVS